MPPEVQMIITALLGLALAFAGAFACTPLVRRLAHLVGAIDDPQRDAERRMHTVPKPRLGGLAIFAGFLAAVLLFGELDRVMVSILLGAVVMAILGAIDDVTPLHFSIKFLVQIGAALIPVLYGGLRIEFFSNFLPHIPSLYINLGAWSYPLTVIWIVAITNAVNFIDGLDGLTAGVMSISSGTLCIIALLLLEPGTAIVAAAITGGCLGFLPYNRNPAKIFMGDSGTLFLGFTLAAVSITGLFKFYTVISFAVPFLMLGLPIFDLIFAIVRRISKGKHPMTPDRGHLHHRLIDMGFTQKRAVSIIYVMSALLGLAAVVLTTDGELRAMIFLFAMAVAAAIAVALARRKP